LSEDVLDALAQEVPSALIAESDAPSVLDLFVRANLVKSKGEARRLADQGGAYVNGDRVAATTTVDQLTRLAGSHVLLRKGAREYAVVTLTD
jgi:tyrosyl-tRNA synthetase